MAVLITHEFDQCWQNAVASLFVRIPVASLT